MLDDAFEGRRDVLRVAGAGLATAVAGCTGLGDGGGGNETEDGPDDGGPDHEVPHPEDSTVTEAETNAETLSGLRRPSETVETKSGVGYQHEPDGDEHCGNCSLYVPDQDGDGFGACYTVGGKIHPCDHCDLWAEYEGDDFVACESL